jgi:acyl-CoA hydrolase
MEIKYKTRKLIKPVDLNARGTLFGGQLLKWIDEEAAIFAICQLSTATHTPHTNSIVTKIISEIDFVNTAKQGDVIEIGCGLIGFGKTSITFACEVRNKNTQQTIVKVDKIVFVVVDKDGKPTPHGMIK